MKVLAVIPSRYASSRFPGKPLAIIRGMTMVEHVWRACRASSRIAEVIVATDDERIATEVQRFGGRVEMTDRRHATGTDRVAEVAQRLEQYDVVLNVQGDQPFAKPDMLEALLTPWRGGDDCEMTTLGCPFESPAAMHDPNCVKVVCARNMHALYFSRSPIPYYREQHDAPVFHHLGLYGFRRDFLLRYGTLEQTPLERCEQLEQLRVLEHGYRIGVAITSRPTLEINTPQDLERANAQCLDPAETSHLWATSGGIATPNLTRV